MNYKKEIPFNLVSSASPILGNFDNSAFNHDKVIIAVAHKQCVNLVTFNNKLTNKSFHSFEISTDKNKKSIFKYNSNVTQVNYQIFIAS